MPAKKFAAEIENVGSSPTGLKFGYSLTFYIGRRCNVSVVVVDAIDAKPDKK